MSHRFVTARAFLACSTAITAAAFGLAAPAAAQSADTDATTADGQLPSIIVTANRREENLQDVAISADTLSQDRIDNIFASGADTTALAGSVPGLNVESSNGRVAPRFYIRGLGNTDFDLAASQPVSVIMDDIVLENVTLKSFPIFDVARIEVLRGPQGTLFGRNTPAGIVKIDTVKPSTTSTDVQAGLSFGSLDTITLNGAVGAPIIDDTLAFRVSTQLQRRGDWISNDFTGEDNVLGGFTDFAVRGQLLLTPGGDDAFSALASVQFRDLDGSSTFFRANSFVPGTNDLVPGFDRKTVSYDAGGGNPGQYQQWGASLKLDGLAEIGAIGFAFIALRLASRCIGGLIGGKLAGVEPAYSNWIGVALMPQAGVALGMALMAGNHFGQLKETLLAIAIGTTVIFEVFGPILTQWALRSVGESKS